MKVNTDEFGRMKAKMKIIPEFLDNHGFSGYN